MGIISLKKSGFGPFSALAYSKPYRPPTARNTIFANAQPTVIGFSRLDMLSVSLKASIKYVKRISSIPLLYLGIFENY